MGQAPPSRHGFSRWIDSDGVRLALISFVGLYFELTFIRWIPTQVRLLAYFSNYVLIAALLGLGVGMLLTGRRSRLLAYFPAALLALAIVILVLERRRFVLPLVAEGQSIWNYRDASATTGLLSYVVLVAFFVAVAGVFVLIGQEIGRALRPMAPLRGYSFNILGSLLGVAAFALLSFSEVSPPVWFAAGGLALLLYLTLLPRPRRLLMSAAAPLVALVALVAFDAMDVRAGVTRHWSPYYEIEVRPEVLNGQPFGSTIVVNKDSHQQALDLSGRFAADPVAASRQRLYDLPYQLVEPKKVLVVGAGTGNDVAAALRNAPEATIDAVEIDPVIVRLGRELHPERPYDDPRVRVHVDDARSFLQKSDERYDLIVFGFLDSHRLFSQMSSVRMDNYVYTRENFARVRDHLAPNGLVAVTFTVHERWIADRIFTLLTRVFDRPPLVYQSDERSWGTVFLAGANERSPPAAVATVDASTFASTVLGDGERNTWRYSDVEGFLDPSVLSDQETLLTDEWPYLYMRSRGVPANYLIVLVLTVLVSLALVSLTVPRIDVRRPSNWNFFLLGAAFALLETKGITEVALVFGSTWITNSIVIAAILLMILLANLVVSRTRGIPLRWVYAALFAALLFNYAVSLRGVLELGFATRVIASGLQVAAPLFFSGIIFACWFERADSTSTALGANLMGAVVGGLLEYGSLAIGLRHLYLVALFFYALSFALTFGVVSLRAAPAREPAV